MHATPKTFLENLPDDVLLSPPQELATGRITRHEFRYQEKSFVCYNVHFSGLATSLLRNLCVP